MKRKTDYIVLGHYTLEREKVKGEREIGTVREKERERERDKLFFIQFYTTKNKAGMTIIYKRDLNRPCILISQLPTLE